MARTPARARVGHRSSASMRWEVIEVNYVDHSRTRTSSMQWAWSAMGSGARTQSLQYTPTWPTQRSRGSSSMHLNLMFAKI